MAYRYNENTMTDTKQPEALRLADAMERFTKSSHWWTDGEPIHIAVAAELRSLHTENDTLRAGYDAARREIESLQGRVNECGAGAGCCAQAARIAELEAQLEAVGGVQRIAGPDTTPVAQAMDLVRVFWQQHTQADALSMTMAELHADAERVIRAALAAPAQPLHVAATNCPHEIDKDKVVLHFDSKQPGKNALAQLAARLQAAQPAAQAQEDAKDAARYRFLRNGEWRDTALEMLIVLQRNSLWDSKIDAAIVAQQGDAA